jgi:membrane-anchored mycosin MYCP
VPSSRSRLLTLPGAVVPVVCSVLLLTVATAVPAGAKPAPKTSPTVQTGCTSPPTTGSATSGTPWPQQRLNFRSAWPISNGTGVTVAVIDSGVDRTQPQMSAIHYADPHNVVTGSSDVEDCVGHGTAVAGIIAAPPRSDTSFVGVAPGVTLIPVRQTDENGKGSSTGIAAGIDWAVAHGARVVNISAGTSTPSAPIEEAIARARAHDVVIVASAGNDGQTSGVRAKAYPAAYATAYDNVIAVAAVDQSDVVTNFSELGGYTTLSAPGVDVIVPALRSGYRSDKGTSFAAPFVTGTVALMLGANPALTPAQVRARLIATADPPPKTVPDPQYGYGIVNPYRAVTAIVAPGASAPPRSQVPLPPLAAPQPPDRSEQHLALGLAAALVVLAAFLLGGWSLARRRRTALDVLHSDRVRAAR